MLRRSVNNKSFVSKHSGQKSGRSSIDGSMVDIQPRYRISIKKKNSARLSEEPGTHRERQSIDDYSKVLKKLKNFGVSKDRAARNLVHELDVDNQFMKNPGNVPHSRKSQ